MRDGTLILATDEGVEVLTHRLIVIRAHDRSVLPVPACRLASSGVPRFGPEPKSTWVPYSPVGSFTPNCNPRFFVASKPW